MKTCSRCKVEKPLADFNKDRQRKDGFYPFCRDCAGAACRASYNGDLIRRREWNRKNMRRQRYGINHEQFEQLVEAQGNKCLICEKSMKRPETDHCHTTGKVRGLLCGSCNRALGLFRDSPELLRRAAGYLLAHSAPVDETFVGDAGC